MAERSHVPASIGRLDSVAGTVAGAFSFVTVAYTLSSALNYLFNLIMTRMLGKAGQFSSFNSLNAIFLVIGLAAISIQTVVAKYVVQFEAEGAHEKTKYLVHDFSRWLICLGLGMFVASAALAWPLAGLLKLSSPALLLILGAAIAMAFYLTVPYGLMQGRQQFVGLGTVNIGSSLLKLILGIVMVALGAGVYGAIGASFLTPILIAAILLYRYRDHFFGQVDMTEDYHPAQALWSLLPVSIALFLVIFMTQVDVVLVKALKGLTLADTYSYGALAGKAVLFFPAGISLVLFPKVSDLKARGEPTGGILAVSLGACLVLEAVAIGFYALFPRFTASVFAGSHGRGLAAQEGVFGLPFVVLFGMVMASFAFINLLVYYQLALDRRLFIPFLAVGAVLQVFGILLFHESLRDVLLVMLVVSLGLLAINLALSLAAAKREREGAGGLAESGGSLEASIARSV